MIGELAIRTAAITLGFFLAVAFYESLSTRDVLLAQTARLTRHFTGRRSVLSVTHCFTVLALIPILVVLWAVVLEAAFTIVGSPENSRKAETAVAVVAAARLLAYLRQRTSHELAKAIPLALAFSLLLGGLPRIEDNLQLLTDQPYETDLTITMLAFLGALEAGLRLLTDLTRASRAGIKRMVATRRRASEQGATPDVRPSQGRRGPWPLWPASSWPPISKTPCGPEIGMERQFARPANVSSGSDTTSVESLGPR